MNEKADYLVVGANGSLGHRIVEAILKTKPERQIRAGIRGGLSGKHSAQAEAWAARGVEIADADLDDAASLARASTGVTTVISAVQGGPDVIIGGQSRLLDAAKTAGAERFVPSDFAEDLFSVPEGVNPNLDMRQTFDHKVDLSGVGYTYFLNGGFMEAVFNENFGLINPEEGTISYWGDGEIPLDFTTMDDTAAWLVAALEDPTTLNSTVAVAGDRRTIADLVEDYAAATGRTLKKVHRGSVAEGYAELERMKTAGAEPMSLLPLQYLLPMMSGEGKLKNVANDRYPEVQPISVRDFMRRYYAA